jgi:hypothetical protein
MYITVAVIHTKQTWGGGGATAPAAAAGDVLLFYNMAGVGHGSAAGGHADPSSFHAGCPVRPREGAEAVAAADAVAMAGAVTPFAPPPPCLLCTEDHE